LFEVGAKSKDSGKARLRIRNKHPIVKKKSKLQDSESFEYIEEILTKSNHQGPQWDKYSKKKAGLQLR
jgi:hypothetical protein